MYVYMYVYVHVYIYICICTYYKYTFIHIYIQIYHSGKKHARSQRGPPPSSLNCSSEQRVCCWMYMYIYICIYTYLYIIHIYIYVYTCIYKYIYIYIHTYRRLFLFWSEAWAKSRASPPSFSGCSSGRRVSFSPQTPFWSTCNAPSIQAGRCSTLKTPLWRIRWLVRAAYT